MRAFSLRRLPRAEELTSHDLYSALAAIAAVNVLLLLVTQRGRAVVGQLSSITPAVNCIRCTAARHVVSSIAILLHAAGYPCHNEVIQRAV